MCKIIRYDSVVKAKKERFFLERPRIEHLIQEAIQRPLTTVVAGAGTGKTSAVLNVLEKSNIEYAWIQLTELDNLIARVWKQLLCCFETCNLNVSKSLALLGYPVSAASFQKYMKILEQELILKKHFVLVLDDYHLLHDETVLTFFEMMLCSLLPNLSVVILSRVKPEFHCENLAVNCVKAEIGENDLRFTREEMSELFQQRDICLSNSVLNTLYNYTEGWVFAIHLLALSLENDAITAESIIASCRIDIYKMLEQEVFNMASPELKELMVRLSLLETTPAGLVNSFADGNPKLLNELNHLSVLAQHDSKSGCYQMHNLLKGFLRKKAKTLPENESMAVYYHAANWFLKNGQFVEAVEYYWRSKAYGEVLDIIISSPGRVSYRVASSFIELIDKMPEDFVKENPIARVVRANFLLNNNHIKEAKRELTKLRKKYEQLQFSEKKEILGEVYLSLGLISIIEQNFDFVELFEKAYQCIPQGSALIQPNLCIAEGINVCGIKKPVAGELLAMRQAMFSAAPYAAKVMNGCGFGMEYLNATDGATMTCELEEAEKWAYETIYRAETHQQTDIEYMANFYLIRILVAQGNFTKIALLLFQMKEKGERLKNADCLPLFDIIEGWLYVKIGRPEQVAGWIMDEDKTRKTLAPVLVGREYLVRSDCMLAQGHYDELLAFMEEQEAVYEERGILYALIQNEIIRAIIYHYTGRADESLAALEKAYTLSAPNNLIFQYIEYGEKMCAVLRAAWRRPDCGIPLEWMEEVNAKAASYAIMLEKTAVGFKELTSMERRRKLQWSKREREVLAGLNKGLPQAEIALRCHAQLEEVEEIVRSIYSKLGAVNTVDAMRIATMMDLV